jgi:hypothetical protein
MQQEKLALDIANQQGIRGIGLVVARLRTVIGYTPDGDIAALVVIAGIRDADFEEVGKHRHRMRRRIAAA